MQLITSKPPRTQMKNVPTAYGRWGHSENMHINVYRSVGALDKMKASKNIARGFESGQKRWQVVLPCTCREE